MALSENRQPLILQGDRAFAQVEVDAELPVLRHNSTPEELDAFFKLSQQQGIGQSTSDADAFVKTMEAAFSHMPEGIEALPDFLLRSVEETLNSLDVEGRQRLEWALIRKVDLEERTGGFAGQTQWEGRKRAAGILLQFELQDISNQVVKGQALKDVQSRRVDALTALTDIETLSIDLSGKEAGVFRTVTVLVDPTMTLDASWADLEANRLVLGTTRTDGLAAVGAYALLQELVRPSGSLNGERLVSLRLRKYSGEGSPLLLSRVTVMQARLDFAAKLDRLGVAVELAKRLDELDWYDSAKKSDKRPLMP